MSDRPEHYDARSVTISVFVLDDHELIRQAVTGLLEREDDLELTGEAGTVETGLAAMLATPPDVAIVDLRLPDGDGIDVCRELRSRHPDTRCLVLTSTTDEEAVMASVLAGAAGFLVKNATGPEIIAAIRQVAAGNSLLDAAVTGKLLDNLRGKPSRSSLSTQEETLLALLAEGLTNHEIAERMHLADKTVRNYLSNLFTKLGLKHRTQAALYGARRQRDETEGKS
jgi:DNA-binding NarL/FixJ family response regulator